MLIMMQLPSAPWGAINFPPMGELSSVLKSLSALPVAITSGIQAKLNISYYRIFVKSRLEQLFAAVSLTFAKYFVFYSVVVT